MRIVCQIFDRKELVDIEKILVILEYADLNREFFFVFNTLFLCLGRRE